MEKETLLQLLVYVVVRMLLVGNNGGDGRSYRGRDDGWSISCRRPAAARGIASSTSRYYGNIKVCSNNGCRTIPPPILLHLLDYLSPSSKRVM